MQPAPPFADQMQSLLATLSAPMLVARYGTKLRVIATSLPGKAVCAVLRSAEDGVMRVVYDPEKPHAAWHTYSMLRTWLAERGMEPCNPAKRPDSMEFVPLN